MISSRMLASDTATELVELVLIKIALSINDRSPLKFVSKIRISAVEIVLLLLLKLGAEKRCPYFEQGECMYQKFSTFFRAG